MTTYWISDYCSLFNSINLNPFDGDDKNYNYNSLTRLIIVVTIAFALLFSDNSLEIFVAGAVSIGISVALYLLTYNSKLPETSTKTDVAEGADEADEADESSAVTKNKNILKSYKDAGNSLKKREDIVKVGITKLGEEIIKDNKQNVENQISIGYVPRNTEQMSAAFFLEPVKSGNINDVKKSDDKRKGPYVSYSKHIQSGTAKQFDSLIGTNISIGDQMSSM